MSAVALNITNDAKGRSNLLHMEIGDFFYYAAFALFCLWQGVTTTTFTEVLGMSLSTFGRLMQIACLGCLLFKLVFQKWNPLYLALAAVLTLVFLLSARQCDVNTLFYTFLFVLAGRNISLKKLAWISLIVFGCLFALTVGCASLGIIDNLVSTRTGELTVREAMGFGHPNRFGMTLLQVVAAWMVIRFPRFSVLDLTIVALSVLAICAVADSRTMALSLVLLVLVLQGGWFFYKKGQLRLFVLISGLLMLLVVFGSFWLMLNYTPSNSLMASFNKLLSGRLSYAHSYFVNYPPSMLGTSFQDAAVVYFNGGLFESRLVVDNAFARMVILYGYAPTFVFLAGLIGLLIRAFKSKSLNLAYLLLFGMVLMGFSESTFLNYSVNYALIVFSGILLGKENAAECMDLATFEQRERSSVELAKD